jgi:hypothetical protein
LDALNRALQTNPSITPTDFQASLPNRLKELRREAA